MYLTLDCHVLVYHCTERLYIVYLSIGPELYPSHGARTPVPSARTALDHFLFCFEICAADD